MMGNTEGTELKRVEGPWADGHQARLNDISVDQCPAGLDDFNANLWRSGWRDADEALHVLSTGSYRSTPPGAPTEQSVEALAKKFGLIMIVTGGGFDFPGIQYPNNGPTLLVENRWTGEGPRSLDEEVSIICYADDGEWRQGVQVFLKDTATAIPLLARTHLQAALIWKAVEHMEGQRDSEPAAISQVCFGQLALKYPDLDLSQLADKVLETHGLTDLHVIKDPALTNRPGPG